MEARSRCRAALRLVVVVLLVIGACAAVVRGVYGALEGAQASKDFKWDGARLILMRQNPLALTVAGKGAVTDEVMPDALGVQELPSALFPILPLGLLGWPAARVVWLICNMVMTYLLLHYAFRLFLPGKTGLFYLALGALVVASTPWRNGITLGQHTIFSLAFLVMALHFAEEGRVNLAGVLLSFAFLKYSVIFPLLLIFVYRRYYRPLLVAFAIHVGLNLAAAAWLGERPDVLLWQSFEASSILVGQGFLDLESMFGRLSIKMPHAAVRVLQCSVLAGAVVAAVRRKGSALLTLAVLSMVSMVLAYHRPYDFIVCMFAFFLWFEREGRGVGIGLAVSATVVFFGTSLVRGSARLLSAETFVAVEQGYYLVLAVVWYGVLVASLGWLVFGGRSPGGTRRNRAGAISSAS